MSEKRHGDRDERALEMLKKEADATVKELLSIGWRWENGELYDPADPELRLVAHEFLISPKLKLKLQREADG